MIDRIKAIFSKYRQIESVLIYGSRAMGNYRPSSDIDLTIKGKNIDISLQTKIEFDLDDLMLPYKFDISVYDKIRNPEFLEHIDGEGKEIYKREEQRSQNTLLP
jgi:predicted nucleotidyltransferase